MVSTFMSWQEGSGLQLENALVGSGYKFVGFFKDDKFTTAFDLTKPMNEDTTVFMKLEEVKNN